MDEPNVSSNVGPSPRRRRAFTFAIVAVALAVLIAAIAWRATTSSSRSSPSANGIGCGDDYGGPSALIGFDDRTGARRWSRRIGDRTAVAQVRGIIAGVAGDGEAIGIDANSGDVKWCHELGRMSSDNQPMYQPAFVAGGDVVATLAANGHVIALDPTTGATRWDTVVPSAEGFSLIGGQVIYVMGIPTTGTAPPAPTAGSGDTPPTAASPPASLPAALPPVVIAALDASNGAILATAPPPPPSKSSAAGDLITGTVYSPPRQEISVGVRDRATGADRWTKVVPGFSASIIGDTVFVIDQTGGTGDTAGFNSTPPQVQTVLSAYAASDGAPRWHVSLPGVPQEAFGANDHIVIAKGPQVFALDPATGATQWTADHGSPGITDRYTEPGEYTWFAASADGASITGLIKAQEPYRD